MKQWLVDICRSSEKYRMPAQTLLRSHVFSATMVVLSVWDIVLLLRDTVGMFVRQGRCTLFV